MAVFILVHGAFHGGWCWERVARALGAAHHHVLTPDLPGMPANPVAHADVTLETTGRFIADLARRQSEKVVLVGHSLGGAAISAAAEYAPAAIAGLVYVAAVLLPDGAAASDLYEDGVPPAGIRLSSDGWTLTEDPDQARRRYYSGCTDADAALALSRLAPQPAGPMHGRLALTTDGYGRLPRAYIQCRRDDMVPFALQRLQQIALPCDPVVTMPTGHSPSLQAPDLLATHLIAAAATFAGRG